MMNSTKSDLPEPVRKRIAAILNARLADAIDQRAVQLGATAEGTVQIVAQRSSLKPYPIEISEGRAHVTALANAFAEVAAKTRAAIDECGQIGDQTSADVFTEVSRGVDKHVWFVEAHLAGSHEDHFGPTSENHE
jgi:starvation-inducible DNA-binding protein